MQTQKVTSFPIILMGSDYWTGLVEWMRGTVLGQGAISEPDLDMFHVTDDVADVVRIVKEAQVRHHFTAPEDEEFQNSANGS